MSTDHTTHEDSNFESNHEPRSAEGSDNNNLNTNEVDKTKDENQIGYLGAETNELAPKAAETPVDDSNTSISIMRMESDLQTETPTEIAQDNPSFVASEKDPDKYFFTEVMSTAGPRKHFEEDAKDGDIELGEDIVGCVVKRDIAFFWVLDGTSQVDRFTSIDKKEIISSRLLAQDLVGAFHTCVLRTKHLSTPENILRSCIKDVAESWTKKLNNLNESDKERLIDILRSKSRLNVSTTAIIGFLNIEGKLSLCKIGDTFFVTHPTQTEQPNEKGRLFFLIKENPIENNIQVEQNPFEDSRFKNVELENIESIIVGTDGISQNTQKWLQSIPVDFTQTTYRDTMKNIQHKTCDDKAICVIQILKDGRDNH